MNTFIGDISNEVLQDARQLRATNIQKRQIREYVIELLRRINDELRNAHNEGQMSLTTELPIFFNITHMTEKNARQEVLFGIIETLKNKNYRVSIDPRKDTCILKIKWISKEDEIEFKYKYDTIKVHTRQF